MDLAHLSTNPLCSLPFTHFTISPSTSSVWIHIVLPPLMTDFSGSSPSSPNTKPEPLQGQYCCDAKPGLSGSSCASVLLPMPHRRQISAKYVVKSSNILWHSHPRNLNAFSRILLILPLIFAYHVVCNEMKRTSSNSPRSAWWTWHISAPILCVVFLSLSSQFHIRLALSRSLLQYLSPSWPIPQHPHQTPSLSPFRASVVPLQFRFVRVEFCFSPSANAWQQYKTSQSLLPHSSHTSSRTHMWSQMKRTNSNSPRSAWWTWHISAPMLCMAPLSLSSPFHLRFALSRSLLQYLSQLWLVPHHRHHPHQTPSLGPGITNLAVTQFQVCQGRVVLQSFCQCLTGDKYLQNTWWNHPKFFEIHIQEISMPSTAFFAYFFWYSHIIRSPMKWKEQAQIHSDLHDGLGTSQHQSM